MKKLFTSVILLLFVAISFGQKSLLWKISGNDLEKPSYLFGTIHLICPDDYFIPENLPEALKQCKQLVLEVDMSDPTLMQKMQAGMMNPQMKNIKADLSEEDAKIINDALVKAMGMGIDQLGIMKPWALSTMIAVTMGLECKQPAQYEMELMKMAKEKEMPLMGLETVEAQLAVFDNIPYTRQLEMLTDGIKNIEEDKALFVKMVDHYKAQDVFGLYKLMLEQDEMADFGEYLLDGRNKNWIPILTKSMNDKACFIAVGAGHLGGENGVIALLRAKGYKVEAVK
ncbi:MAG: TraB/GumN family protein [Carboxylicivirga sp.]|jgi:uncharacterized protein YbaP (TraB family)|nr:TraB/GumN family protein [Carboxylicivirga sp.]